MEVGYESHIGKMRKINQDSYMVGKTMDGMPCFAVADGLGGHRGGETASKMLIEELSEFLSMFNASDHSSENKLEYVLKEQIKTINKHILERGKKDESLAGMGSTLTFCVITSGKQVHVFHVGDSRLYRISQKAMERMTRDHSYVEELIESGEITRSEAEHHPNKNLLTRAVGTDASLEVDYTVFELNKGDAVLICSDGLTNYVPEDDIRQIITDNTCSQGAQKLIQTANDNGGGDNITAIVFKLEVHG
jgi:protein phosphatase